MIRGCALIVAQLGFAACSHRDPAPPASGVVAPVAPVAPAAVAASPIPASANQLVTAITADWTSTRAELRRWQRDGSTWHAVGDPWPAVIGKTGAAWGAGLHGVGAPSGHDGPLKHEGDGKSPAGVFAIAGSYGYAPSAPAGTRLAYTALDANWQCVDDVKSTQYTRILDRRTAAAIDWTSAEQMRRPDALYTWVLDVAHNTARTPGGGSCIFLHVWSGPDSTTVGCTAMAEPTLATLVATLDRDAVFVLLPRAEYDRLAASWALPR